MYFLHQSLPHKLKEDARFYWQFKTKWEELTVCIFFQLPCYQGNVRFISSATSISNLPSPYYLLPDVMRFGKKIFPNCSKGVSCWQKWVHWWSNLGSWIDTIAYVGFFQFSYCITIPFLDTLGLFLLRWVALTNHMLYLKGQLDLLSNSVPII